MTENAPRPYLPLDLDFVDRFHANGPLILGRNGGALVVRVYADAPDETPTDFQRAHDFVTELVRLARVGQKLENQIAARLALEDAARPLI